VHLPAVNQHSNFLHKDAFPLPFVLAGPALVSLRHWKHDRRVNPSIVQVYNFCPAGHAFATHIKLVPRVMTESRTSGSQKWAANAFACPVTYMPDLKNSWWAQSEWTGGWKVSPSPENDYGEGCRPANLKPKVDSAKAVKSVLAPKIYDPERI
jgi:hypothetical protein